MQVIEVTLAEDSKPCVIISVLYFLLVCFDSEFTLYSHKNAAHFPVQT